MYVIHGAPCALLAALMLLPGCSGISHSLSPNYPQLIAAVPFKADRPIAREIRYVYFSATEISGKPGKPIFATNYGSSEAAGSGPMAPEMPTQRTTGTISDQYSAKAREAMKTGDHLGANIYSGLAVSSLETEMAMVNMVNNVNAAFNVYFATANALSAAAQGFQDSGGRKLHDWTVATTGAIGDAAPPGSVLYLNIMDVGHITRFDMDSKWDLVVNAALVDGNGKTVATSQGLELYTHSGQDTQPLPGYVMLEKLPQEKARHFESVNSIPQGFLKATLINGAIADLYRKLYGPA